MPLNLEMLKTKTFPVIDVSVGERDAMLYALSIGLGQNPLDPVSLGYVYEKNLHMFPSQAIVLGHPGNWMDDPATGITRQMVVHGAQRMKLAAPLRIEQSLQAFNRIVAVHDKGESKGAVIVMERRLTDKVTGDLMAVLESVVFCRADGGFAGSFGAAPNFTPAPERQPDIQIGVPTRPEAALIYRLNGDYNPLHADPEVARAAKYDRPILHGLYTFGAAAVAVMRNAGAMALTEFEGRFSSPVFPGETITVDIWEMPDYVAFRARNIDRGVVVLDRGRAVFS